MLGLAVAMVVVAAGLGGGTAEVAGAAGARQVAGAAATGAAARGAAASGGAAVAPGGSDEDIALDTASSEARQTGEVVEVTELRAEAADTWANPDGTFTLRSFDGPVRVRTEGGWAPVDTTLSDTRNGIRPASTPADLRLSSGGTGPMATLSEAGHSLSLSWPGALPAPQLSGSTATYPDVLPGVDLIVRAEAEGFSEVLQVESRTAAANPALQALDLGAAAQGLTLRAGAGTGGANGTTTVEAVNAAGTVELVSPGAYAWDSSYPDPSGASPGPIGAGASCSVEPPAEAKVPVPVDVTGGGLTVTPDPALLTGPDTVYPVCIDPGFTGLTNAWTSVDKAAPNTSYWSSNRDSMRVGRVWGGGTNDVHRSFVRIDIGGIVNRGVTIVSAAFRSELDHSGSCGPTPVELWHTDSISSSSPATTWNNTNSFGTSGFWNTNLGAVSGNADEAGGCGVIQPDKQLEWNTTALRNAVQGMANGTSGTMTFGLKAPHEGDIYEWKRFYPGNSSTSWQRTYLSVTFNRNPDKPTLQPLAPCYLACGSPGSVRSITPTLTAGVHDADNPTGAVLKTWFEIWDPTHATLVTKNATAIMATSGGRPAWTPAAGLLANGTTYHWRVRVVDELNAGSVWSDWGVFSVDTGPPGAPGITSPNYPEKQWGPGEGTVASFDLTPGGTGGGTGPNDVAEYTWTIDGQVPPTKVATSDGTETITWTTRGVVNRLRVFAVDRAGNPGPTTVYELWVTPTPNRFSEWRLDETSGTTAADTGRNHVAPFPGTLSAGASWTAGRVANGVHLTGTGAVTTAGPVLDTTRDFSVAAWVRPGALPATDATAVAQDGTSQSMFRLFQRGSDHRWCFGVRPSDAAGATPVAACSTVALPQAGQWAHLVGVYDTAAGTISLYVNGGPDGDGSTADAQAPVGAPWMATGPLTIGRARTGTANAPGEWFGGDVDEVVAAQRALGPVEIGQLASGGRMS